VTQPFRTAAGGRIDRAAPLGFTFDGRSYDGFAGDTLASALLANGVHLVGRSFKYHRPRGIVSAGAEEPNALVTVDPGGRREVPNLPAPQVELFAGLRAVSQNRFPSLDFDLGAVAGLFAPMLGAGFYYKTFMWPPGFWRRVYEPLIRRAAGLGRAPTLPDPDRYLHRYAHCDVLVIGSGPAGIAAALAASETGVRVVLCDEQAEFGGSLLAESAAIERQPAGEWLESMLAVLRDNDRVRLLPRTTAFGWFPENLLGLAERVTDHIAAPDDKLPRERLWQVRAKQVVIAAGAIERPLLFPNNDRPGVMLADAARTYALRYGVRIGNRVVIATAHDSAYRAALDLRAAGVEIAAIADLRDNPSGPGIEAARAAGIEIRPATSIVGTRGGLRVAAASLASGPKRASIEHVACDAVLTCGGWTPSVHLFSQSRGKVRFDPGVNAYVPGTSAARERSAGGCNGAAGLAACLAEGSAAGAVAARDAGFPTRGGTRFAALQAGPAQPGHLGLVPGAAAKMAFVDPQNDVTAKDLALATREGFRSIEHVKRYTTTGMATDQGKTSNLNALAVVAKLTGRTIPEIGVTTFRMPCTPVTFGTIAGASRGMLFDPVRQTPIHSWAAAQSVVFEDVGNWKRARYFPRAGEDMHAAVARECLAVRNGVGVFDASTLGKIEIVGPDAAEFINRMYTGAFAKMSVGACRYALMLNEAGFVMDDGIIARLAPDRFHVTTTTGGAASVLNHMEDYLQTEFTGLRVWLTSIMEQWAVIAVQGPLAREVVAPLVEDIDIAAAAMPHMSIRTGRICGVPARLFRVSFTGELGYEINVPADYGRSVWAAVVASGERHGITPYGTEAMHVLRAEKGYIIVGQETDGTATPADLGMDWAIAKTKRDFVGKRSLTRPDMIVPQRPQLVGLLTADPQTVIEEGAQIVADPDQPVPMTMIGHVTSSYASATLGRSIALAMVAGGRARLGATLYVPMPGRTIAVVVVAPAFFDTDGRRLHG